MQGCKLLTIKFFVLFEDNPLIPGSFYKMAGFMLHMSILGSFRNKLWPNPEMAQNKS